MIELMLLPAGAVVLALGVYGMAARLAEGDGRSLSMFNGCVILVVFGALIGGSLWSDDAAHHATALLPTLGVSAVLGARAGFRKWRRPIL